jgi:hypothetical protein
MNKIPRPQLPVAVSLGCDVKGAVLPHPEMRGWETQKAAVEGRLGCQMPKVDKKLIRRLRVWNMVLCRKLLQPVSSTYFSVDFLQCVDHWLSLTNYTQLRRRDLRAKAESLVQSESDLNVWLRRNYCAKGFVKDESYEEWKISRGIHPESDEVKVVMGPLFKAIEEIVYHLKSFVKHIAVTDRPNYMMSNVEQAGWVKILTDFSSFEAGFSPDAMHALEFPMYRYMLRNCPAQLKTMVVYEACCCNYRTISYKDVRIRVRGRRLSGQMCTSLGNTWSNFVLLTYLMKDHIHLEHMRLAVEGDDGVTAVPPEVVPLLDRTVFERAGFKIKLEFVSDIAQASFCGMVFDPEDRVNVTNPWPEIVAFGWSGGQAIFADQTRRMMLLRAKSMSLAYQYHRCPVIHALARYGLRVTGVVSRDTLRFVTESTFYNEYERRNVITAAMKWNLMAAAPVPIRTRELVSRLYAIPIEQQLAIESYFDSLDKLQQLEVPCQNAIWRENAQRFVREFKVGTLWRTISASRPLLV